jgi:hypothetical protein
VTEFSTPFTLTVFFFLSLSPIVTARKVHPQNPKRRDAKDLRSKSDKQLICIYGLQTDENARANDIGEYVWPSIDLQAFRTPLTAEGGRKTE